MQKTELMGIKALRDEDDLSFRAELDALASYSDDDLHRNWRVFTTLNDHIKQGVRLENVAWRLLHQRTERKKIAKDARDPSPDISSTEASTGGSCDLTELHNHNASGPQADTTEFPTSVPRVSASFPNSHEVKPVASGRERSTKAPPQWWRDSPTALLCPLSGFPVSLLPYPPFKFRKDPQFPEEFELVDGKYLVLQIIASGGHEVCGRALMRSDISALDKYIRRCNLGPLQLGSTIELQHTAATTSTPGERASAEEKLAYVRARAQTEWRKLQRIKDQRLARLQSKDVAAPQRWKGARKNCKAEGGKPVPAMQGYYDTLLSAARPAMGLYSEHQAREQSTERAPQQPSPASSKPRTERLEEDGSPLGSVTPGPFAEGAMPVWPDTDDEWC